AEYMASLPASHQKLLREIVREYRRGGIDLPADKKTQLKKLDAELSKLNTDFTRNLVEVSDACGIAITDVSELAGLEPEFIDACRQAAEQKGLPGYWVGYSEPNYAGVMSHCSHAPTRAAFYKAANTRAAKVNEAVAQDILRLRKQRAQLLGYKNHAEYVLETRMVKKPAVAIDFIADLARRYKPRSVQEYHQTLAFAREYEKNPELELGVWEVDSGLDFYYAQLLREKTCDFSEKTVSEYFPLATVRDGMFSTLATLYGVTFSKAPADITTWHEAVEVYDIRDQAGHHLARVWCDWLARPGKNGGAWMTEYYVAERANNTFDKPHLGYVVCNFSLPTATKPSLLSIREVETMWHEFGHYMHLALSRTALPEQAAVACKWDFIEAPSQIMENWVWQPQILQRISKHYQTGQPLPDDLIKKMLTSQNFRVAAKAMRQFNYATIDLVLHTSYDPDGQVGVIEQGRRTKADFVPLPVPDFESSITGFAHIFSGGYAAGYYGYKWAEAIQADLFSRFATEGVLNPEVGQAYAEQILARGDEAEPEVLVRNFLGRESSNQAMLERDGIA
ncbi:MAG TPA: M3 family metallopeptidase, partial [Candidatus Acidoferrum sp.]|nr:M3 family metallopeptidase [Candidatus Acidoferrum sp.]